jgi:TolB protein
MKFFRYLVLIIILLPLLVSAKETDVYIGLSSKYNPQDLPKIALGGFGAKNEESAEEKQTAATIASVVRADLMRSRNFNIIDNIPPVDANNLGPVLTDYKKDGINYLLFGEVNAVSGAAEQWEIKAFLYDSESQKAVLAKSFKSSAKSIRRTAHILSDNIVLLLTGRRGIADTKIAFANDSTGRKEIYMVDYDGYNLAKLTKDNSIALLPRWSSDSTKIYYTTYRRKNPDIFAIDLKEGAIKPIIKGDGLNLIGGVSPDDKRIVLTLSRGDNPNIYLKELESGLLSRLTDKYGVDGSPSFSPDGKFVTFVSNRSGNPQIYTLNIETKELRRLTKFNWADSPQWSPTGEWIVFAGRLAADHPIDIFIVDITGGQLRQLTSDAGSNEDPTWSPDGRFIAFTTTRGGKRQVYVMDADGSTPHLIANIRGDSYTPNWSK